MQKRHLNNKQYFEEQAYTSEKFVIPYINSHIFLSNQSTVLEIGCGEGGNLIPFINMGCKVTGIDLAEYKIKKGTEYFKENKYGASVNLVYGNIYENENLGVFDVIILRDVIEHLPNQEMFMSFLKHFVHDKSVIFFGFPPWQNPFGGHQQICHSKFLSKLPYFHLLPRTIYLSVLKWFGEKEGTIKELMAIRKTGISIERFERIVREENYSILQRTHYFINPNYEVKFGLKPRIQLKLVSRISWARNFLTTAVYYLICLDPK